MTVYPVERLCARSRSAPFKNGSRFTISLQDGNLLDNPPPFDGRISKGREGDGHGHRFQVEGVEGRVGEAGGSYLELIGRSCSSSIHGRIRSWNLLLVFQDQTFEAHIRFRTRRSQMGD